MTQKRYTAEQIIIKLREAEVDLAQGQTVGQVSKQIGVTEQTYYRWRCRLKTLEQIGVTEQTYYRWRKEYGGLRAPDPGAWTRGQAVEDLRERERPVKKLVADLSLDNQILKEVSSGNF